MINCWEKYNLSVCVLMWFMFLRLLNKKYHGYTNIFGGFNIGKMSKYEEDLRQT